MSEWRQLVVSDAINRAAETGVLPGWSARLMHVSGFLNYLDPAVQDIVGPSSAICFQRNLIHQQVLDAISYWQSMNIPVCVDLDDQYWGLPRSNPAEQFWIQNSSKLDPPPLVMMERGLAQCNALTSPNRLILSDVKHLTKGYVIPNFARAEWWTPEIDRSAMRKARGISDDKIIVGWGGSCSHIDSWYGSGIFEAARRISYRHPEVLWLVAGNDPRIHAQLPVSPYSKFMQPGVDPSQWPAIVKMFDIGVAPLYGPYDQRRSWIKGMEYALAGVPWVGTTGEPYSDIADLGKLIVNSPDAWEVALEEKIANLRRDRELAHDYIPLAQKRFLITNNLGVYEKVYGQIINDFNMDRARLPGVYWTTPKAVEATPA